MTGIYCFQTVEEMAETMCHEFCNHVSALSRVQQRIGIAFSGGNTPKVFFKHLAASQKISGELLNWNTIHIFWVDERCVPPDHPDSNYGMTLKHLLQEINIPDSNIHRIWGENNPVREAGRYSEEILRFVVQENGIPVFDWIFLGMGSDGHTASIFPDRLDLMNSVNICEAVKHPSSGQNRITLTGRTIMNANRITFMVTGKSKSKVIRQILEGKPEAEKFPAGLIKQSGGKPEYYFDGEAAIHITSTCHGKH
ncbi:MAG TPA: 6-phosphogluconolactonase [Bacteroidales bacterium]|nr:6-phosphogluconolactonase [Bacteroidales bacterium]